MLPAFFMALMALSMNILQCGKFQLDCSRPRVMGIVNLTPDSFSGDGLAKDRERAIAHAHAQIEAGAEMLDLGAESSRPGCEPTPLDEELGRLLPVVKALAGCGVPLSIDTYKPEVMVAVLEAGADMINDIYGFRHPGAWEAVAASDCGLCIMHMQGEPRDMQARPAYEDVVTEVVDFFQERLEEADQQGIDRRRITLDPGFGFGKSVAHNLTLLGCLEDTRVGGLPLFVGMSRKSMIGAVTGRPVGERVFGSVAGALLAAQRGAAIIRVHDVAATRDALAMWQAVAEQEMPAAGND